MTTSFGEQLPDLQPASPEPAEDRRAKPGLPGAVLRIPVSVQVVILIGLLQALTQIQEATLTFVPKILAVFAALLLLAPMAAAQLMSFTEEVYAHIETGF